MNTLRPFLSGVIAPWIIAAIAALTLKFGLAPDALDVNKTVDVIVDTILWLVPAMASGGSLLKRLIDTKLNPANAATPTLAEKGKADQDLYAPATDDDE